MVTDTTHAVPAEKQIEFLRNVQRLLTEGSFVATYKYALLHAIADLTLSRKPEPDGGLILDTREIAERVIELYWRQTAPYPLPTGEALVLKQNTGKQAAILNHVHVAYRGTAGSLAQVRRSDARWNEVVAEVRHVVEVMPLWKLQTVGSDRLEFLYPNTGSGHSIHLFAGVPYCLRSFYGLILELVRSAWLRHVRRFNPQVEQAVELSSFLFGQERSNLSSYRRALEEVDASFECFYCAAKMTEKNVIVDHFVPWSKYPNDLGHNFVLAHERCNGQKSDFLASVEHLERWLERNRRLADDLAGAFDRVGLLHNREASVQVSYWAYDQVQVSGGQVWVSGKQLRPLDPEWVLLFAAHESNGARARAPQQLA